MKLIRLPWSLVCIIVRGIFLAVGQIWAHKVRSILTTTGIVIGVASVTAVVAALTGLKAKVLADFETVGAKSIWAYPMRPTVGPNKRISWEKLRFKPEDFEGLLEHCPSLETFTKRTWWATTMRKGSRVLENIDIIGLDPSWHKVYNRSIIMGRPFSHIDQARGAQVCIIPPVVRDKLLLDRDCVGETVLIGDRTFRIVGVVEPPLTFEAFGNRPEEEIEVFVPFNTIYNDAGSRIGMVQALAKSPEVAEEARAEMAFFLRRARKIAPGDPDTFGVQTLQRMLEVFNNIATAVTAVAGGIVGISLLVGGVGIMNIMLVSVSERTREIGLRKAVGARGSAILLQFLIEAVALCLAGGGVGVVVGQLLTMGLASIPDAQLDKAYIPLWAVVLSFGFATSVGLFFGMFPAIKAARLDPIEALRHE